MHLIVGAVSLPVYRALKNPPLHLITKTMSCPTTVSSTTAPVEPAGPAHQGHKPPCRRATGNLHSQRDHGDQHLHHDRNALHDQHHRDIDHRIDEQLGISRVDNLEGELQLRSVTRAPVVAHNGRVNDQGRPVRPHNREIGHNVNELWNLFRFLNRTMGISHCVKTGMSTTFEEQLQSAELPDSLHCLDHGTLVQELHLWRLHGLQHCMDHEGPQRASHQPCPRAAHRCTTTGERNLSKNCTTFCTVWTRKPVVA